MANQEHLDILAQGVEAWNQWRKEHAEIKPNLSNADLSRADLWKAKLRDANLSQADLFDADLRQADLRGADLSNADLGQVWLGKAHLRGTNLFHANLTQADLFCANLRKANLSEAIFSGAELESADLRGSNLSKASLFHANLSYADLTSADLSGADLTRATLVDTNLTKCVLNNCMIYGISAWDLHLEEAEQSNLIITSSNQPTITVDNLEVAQFIYLLLNNPKIRDVIDTIAKKAVLILGRFTPDRKAVLDALREALRTHGYLPILFDFDKPSSRDLTETVSILAHLARFIIADLTEPSSIPKELEAIVPTLAVPVQPLLEGSARPYAMFKDYWKYQWVLKVYRYNGLEELLASLKEYVIEPAERKAKELAKLKAEE